MITLPAPKVKKGKWAKERERIRSGRWRKKRKDAGKKRRRKALFDWLPKP